MSFITELSDDYSDFLLDFIKWYKSKKFNMAVKELVAGDTIHQLPILQYYIYEKHNIGIHFDRHSIVLYWVSIKIDRAEKDILNRFHKDDKLTNTFLTFYDLLGVSFENAYKRSVLKGIDYLIYEF